MKGFLLDTNCISELVSAKPEPKVLNWIGSIAEELIYLSVLTLGEIGKGVAGLPPGSRRKRLESWMEIDLKIRFSDRLLPVDDAVAIGWGSLAAQAKAKGRPLAVIDGLIAATALHHDLTLVTRNVTDFTITNVPLLNPWQG